MKSHEIILSPHYQKYSQSYVGEYFEYKNEDTFCSVSYFDQPVRLLFGSFAFFYNKTTENKTK